MPGDSGEGVVPSGADSASGVVAHSDFLVIAGPSGREARSNDGVARNRRSRPGSQRLFVRPANAWEMTHLSLILPLDPDNGD